MPVRRNPRAESALNAARHRTIHGVDIYVASTEDRIATGRRLRIQESQTDRWVATIDADLRPYADMELELRLPDGVTPDHARFRTGPKVRRETLIRGVGPAPRPTY